MNDAERKKAIEDIRERNEEMEILGDLFFSGKMSVEDYLHIMMDYLEHRAKVYTWSKEKGLEVRLLSDVVKENER